MKVSYTWLQDYFEEKLPEPQELVDVLTFGAFEVEGIEEVGEDFVIDVDVLPNRAHDCLSHRGIAKELSTLLNTKLKNDTLSGASSIKWIESNMLEVIVEDEKLCDRYSAAVIQGVSVGPSPEWLQKRLEALGQKSINNIVDATNYVMFDIGQPLHAFDMSHMKEKNGMYSILVRRGKSGEKVEALDDEKYDVGPENLLITDGNNDAPIGIAGVKGGKAALISGDTKNIIIESAHFNPTSIRKTSQVLKLRTDASARFENEPSSGLPRNGIDNVVALIQKIAGGEVEGYIDVYPQPQKSYKVGVSLTEVNKLLGSDMKEKDMTDIFDRFNFLYKKVNPLERVLELAPTLVGKPYVYGAHVLRDAPDKFDCSSFVAYVFAEAGVWLPRISIDQYVYGEDVQENDLQKGDIVFSVGSDEKSIRYESVDFMKGTKVESGVSHCGIYLGSGKVIHASGKSSRGEVVIDELAESKDFKNITGYKRMTNSDERHVVVSPFERLDLQIPADLIEEIGRVYGYKNIAPVMPEAIEKKPAINKRFYYTEKARDFLVESGFSEVYTYSFKNEGEVELQNALASDKSFIRANLTDGLAQSLESNMRNADLLGLKSINIFEFGTVFSSDGEYMAFGMGSKNSQAGGGGDFEIVTELGNHLGAPLPDAEYQSGVFEINFDEYVKSLPEPEAYDAFTKQELIAYKDFSAYPVVLRDIAVWVPESVTADDVLGDIKKIAGELLIKSSLFDEYKKDGRVSYAFNLVFQSHEKTLTDDEIGSIMESVTNNLNGKKDWEVR